MKQFSIKIAFSSFLAFLSFPLSFFFSNFIMSQEQIQEERNTRILQITRALVREHSTCHDVQFMAMMIYRTLHDNCVSGLYRVD